jgi:lysophospholipase L1-like esterase
MFPTSRHSPSRIRWSRRLVAVTVAAGTVLCLLVAGAGPAAATGRGPTGPRHYYLSLGDSYGFGLQLTRFFEMLDAGTYTPEAFNTGYTDDLAALMRPLQPGQQVVNYSCPGASTNDMLTDGCFFTDDNFALHDPFTGAQLDAAVAFLHAHPGQVSPITVSIGGADLLGVIYDDCNGNSACILHSPVTVQMLTNLSTILGRLRAAAPTADIVLLAGHNPASFDFPASNAAWGGIVLAERAVAAAHQVKVADAFAAITLTGRTCTLTPLCDPNPDLRDNHPNDAGYAVMARLFFEAAGYGHIGH